MMPDQGVGLYLKLSGDIGSPRRCLVCGSTFLAQTGIVQVRSGGFTGEILGHIGGCCMEADVLARVNDVSRGWSNK